MKRNGTTFIKVSCSHACTPLVPVTANAIFYGCCWMLCLAPPTSTTWNSSKAPSAKLIAQLAKNFFSSTSISNKHCKKWPRRLRQQDFALFSPLPLLIASQKSPSTLGFVSQPHGRGHPLSCIACSKKETITTWHLTTKYTTKCIV